MEGMLHDIPSDFWAPYCVEGGCMSREKMKKDGSGWVCKSCGVKMDAYCNIIENGTKTETERGM